jgi:hypothetical protein
VVVPTAVTGPIGDIYSEPVSMLIHRSHNVLSRVAESMMMMLLAISI